MTHVVYLDNAASTPVRPEVLDAMMPYLTDETFGNPSSAHRFGQAARAGVERARRQIADALGVEPGEVIFTSGGTEADNLAVIGAALAQQHRGGPLTVAVGAAEHKAVIAAAKTVQSMGGDAVFLPVDERCQLEPSAVEDALGRRPAVLSAMWVNNEVGIIQDVRSLAERCSEAGVVFHTDAVQAVGKIPCRIDDIPCTLLAVSGHKIGAPKGVGALVVRDRTAVEAIIHGGGQQFGIRPGTENVAGIVGLGEAVALAVGEVDQSGPRLGALRDAFEERVLSAVPDVTVIGADAHRAPHISAVAFPGIDPQALLVQCDLAGVACSTGSACNTGLPEPSHVLDAMGLPREITTSMVRFSFFKQNSEEDVNRVIEVLPGLVEKVRRLSAALGE
jgi:cysteine desulfurase